jgi:hypothetical protein
MVISFSPKIVFTNPEVLQLSRAYAEFCQCFTKLIISFGSHVCVNDRKIKIQT